MLRRSKFAVAGVLAGVLFCAAVAVYGLLIRWGDETWGSPQGGLYVLAATVVVVPGLWMGLWPPQIQKP